MLPIISDSKGKTLSMICKQLRIDLKLGTLRMRNQGIKRVIVREQYKVKNGISFQFECKFQDNSQKRWFAVRQH